MSENQRIIGDIRNCIGRLEGLLIQSPGFLPAEFVLAAAYICSGQRRKGLNRLKNLRPTKMGPNLAATCQDLVQRLVKENRANWASTLNTDILRGGAFSF